MEELAAIKSMLPPMINKVRDAIDPYIRGQYHWPRDVQEDLKKLESTLLGLQAVMAASERLDTREANQVAQPLKNAIYEADDLLDEFEYSIMQAQAQSAQGKVIRAASYSIKFAKHFVVQYKLHTKLTEILQKLDIVKDVAVSSIRDARLAEKFGVEQVLYGGRVTSSIQMEAKIVGRKKEKNEIINLLLNIPDEPESSYAGIPIVTIVGLGGHGKTTLARSVYNDNKIMEHFELRIWVCVSDDFDIIKLTREMLECVSGSHGNYRDIMHFDMLQIELQRNLCARRFLLVLDDVWLDEKRGFAQNMKMWDELLAPLQGGAWGSKILVTTRTEAVAEIFGTRNMIHLEGLSKDETWSLFKSCAFGGNNPEDYPELQQIGRQIVEKMNGSPLATKAVGAMLKDSLDVDTWKRILNNNLFGESDMFGETDIMSILRLSYHNLPDHLKPCFAYCSIFPKDWKFEPKKLVLLWIAQGYIQPSFRNQRPMEDVGMDYFDKLVVRSFYQMSDQRHSCTYYVIHDLMHDLAQLVSRDECFRIDGGKHRVIERPMRHLGVAINDEYEIRNFVVQLDKQSNLRNLRTLIFFERFCYSKARINLPLSMFKVLSRLRVLDFGDLVVETYPKAIGDLMHLRYLNLGKSEASSVILPKSVGGLYHLQVLASHRGLSFSKSIIQLNRFGRLTQLHAPLLEFPIKKKKGSRIGELKYMTVIPERLHIKNLESITKKEAHEADMGSKDIDELMLEWDRRAGMHGAGKDLDVYVLEALKPHPSLKRLRIIGFRGVRLPSWLVTGWLINLESIHLSFCSNLEVLPSLDQLPSLEELMVKECPKLMSFPLFPPTLREIEIHGTKLISDLRLALVSSSLSSERFYLRSSVMPSRALLHDHALASIEELDIRNCKEPMPAGGLLELFTLEKLQLADCPELMVSTKDEKEEGSDALLLPASLKWLHIFHCSITDGRLSKCLQDLTSLFDLKIESCDHLTSLPSAQVLHRLTALQELEICACENLTSLGGLHALASLKRLGVVKCAEVKSLPEEGLPSSIERLHLEGCHPVLMRQMRAKRSPEWDKVADIRHIDI